jgi:hypothetical protein
MTNGLNNRARNLEDEFFLKEDQKLIQKLREMRQMKETREALALVSGIKNEAVLNKLVELQVRPETIAALALIPLIEVAWADGNIDEKERSTVLKATEKVGFARQDIDRVLLEEWLKKKPDPELLNVWSIYIQGLCQELDASQINLLKAEFIGHARQVAEASGGILGVTRKISAKEEKMLGKIEEAFPV